jgi:hypothetical protein
VVLLAETPFLPYDPVDDCLAVEDATKCDPPRSVVVDAEYAELERRASVDAGAELLSVNELLCNERTCPVYDDGAVFRDNHHVTASYMAGLAGPIGNLLEGRPAYPTPAPTVPAASAQTDGS